MHVINGVSAQRWVWRVMMRNALVPLVLVETVLIAAYMLSNQFIRDANIEYVFRHADSELQLSVQREAEVVREQLLAVSRLSEVYRTALDKVLSSSTAVVSVSQQEKQNYERSPDGVLYSKQDIGGAASFYSAITPANKQDLNKVYRLAQLDPLMKVIKDTNPLVSAVYFNSWDSYNRIYPWFKTPDRYPSDMNIPNYNFYYMASADYNPLQMPTWTNVYIDPAGGGWMTSCIVPVYRDTFLEGVAGFDIRIKAIIDRIQKLQIPWGGYAILVNSDGNIMALPPAGERDFDLKELTDYSYQDAIRHEVFKPERFNLFTRNRQDPIVGMIQNNMEGNGLMTLNGRRKLVAWQTIPETWWKLITVVDEQSVYSETKSLADHFRQIGYLMIAGLIVFYVCFISYLGWRSRRTSRLISGPLQHMSEMVNQISHEDYVQEKPRFQITELQETAKAIVRMAQQIQHITTDLRAAKSEAEKANKSKNLFLSSMSHELRTPLNAILGFGQLLQNDMSLSQSERINYANEILTAGHHLLSLIDDVLNLSNIEANKLAPLKIESVDAVAVCAECCEMLRHLAEDKKLSLTTKLPDQPMLVLADRTRLRQIIINLVSNAIKYNHSYGWVQITVDLMPDRHMIKISVHDTGNGIQTDRQTELFQPFNRLGYETSGIHGTGIGLSISKQLIESMRGEIGYESVWQEGSLFWIELPASTDRVEVQQLSVDSSEQSLIANHTDAVEPESLLLPHRVILLGCDPVFMNRMQRLSQDSSLTFIDYTSQDALLEEIGHDQTLNVFIVNIDDHVYIDALQHLRSKERFRFASIVAVTTNPIRLSQEVTGNLFYDYVLMAPLDELHVLSVIHRLMNLPSQHGQELI